MIYRRLVKPVFDRTIAFLLIIGLSPIWCLGVVMIYIFQGGPIFYMQMRSGIRMKRFTIYKFRTLEDSKTSELSLGHRSYSRLGRVLRKFSLDELPQIYNVLIGEMSFVGPRALPVEYDSKYNDFQRYRFHCKPGMTGWAQVNGRNTISWDEKFQYDHWYVDNISFYVDLKIILLTFFKLFQQEGTKEMPVFTGSELN